MNEISFRIISWYDFLIWFLTIIFVRIEIQSLLRFLRIEVSDLSKGFLSSGSASGSNSPDDWGRMLPKGASMHWWGHPPLSTKHSFTPHLLLSSSAEGQSGVPSQILWCDVLSLWNSVGMGILGITYANILISVRNLVPNLSSHCRIHSTKDSMQYTKTWTIY